MGAVGDACGSGAAGGIDARGERLEARGEGEQLAHGDVALAVVRAPLLDRVADTLIEFEQTVRRGERGIKGERGEECRADRAGHARGVDVREG